MDLTAHYNIGVGITSNVKVGYADIMILHSRIYPETCFSQWVPFINAVGLNATVVAWTCPGLRNRLVQAIALSPKP